MIDRYRYFVDSVNLRPCIVMVLANLVIFTALCLLGFSIMLRISDSGTKLNKLFDYNNILKAFFPKASKQYNDMCKADFDCTSMYICQHGKCACASTLYYSTTTGSCGWCLKILFKKFLEILK